MAFQPFMSFFISAALVCGLIGGGGVGGIGCSRQVTPPEKTIVLSFWTLQMLNFADDIRAMIREYEASHPGVRIRWVDVPMSEGEKRALTSMLSDTPPDVLNLNPDFSAILASRGALLDLNDWVTPAQKASYLPVTWETASLQGKAFGLPWYVSSAVTLYNQTLFGQAGLSAPPTHFGALIPAARRMKAKTPGYLLMPTMATGGRFFKILAKQGIPLWNAHGRAVFADHGAGAALHPWRTLFREGLVPREALTEDPQATVDRYQSGTLGMLLTGPNFLTMVRENAPRVFESTRVAPQFPQDSPMVDFSQMVLVIPQKSRYPEAAVDFALFVTNPKNTLHLSTLAPVLPPHRSALETAAFQEFNNPDILARARSMSARQLLQARHGFGIHPQQKRMNERMDYYVQLALLEKLSPEEAMQRAQDAMNRLVMP